MFWLLLVWTKISIVNPLVVNELWFFANHLILSTLITGSLHISFKIPTINTGRSHPKPSNNFGKDSNITDHKRKKSFKTRLKRLSVLDREITFILGLFETFEAF